MVDLLQQASRQTRMIQGEDPERAKAEMANR